MTDEETGPDGGADTGSRRRLVIIVAVTVAAALLIVGIVLAVMLDTAPSTDSGSGTGPSPSATTSPSSPAASSPVPSASAGAPSTGPVPSPDQRFGEPVAEEVARDEPARFTDGVSARIEGVDPFEATGSGVGEVSGSAVRVEVSLENGSGTELALAEVVVNLYYGAERSPASPLRSDADAQPFNGTLAVGDSARGAYSFSVPAGSVDDVLVTVSSRAGTPIVVFG